MVNQVNKINPGNSFGISESDEFFTIDTAGGLIFKIRRLDYGASTQSPGDIASLVYNGLEFQDKTRGSQINSGFDYLYSGVSDVDVQAVKVNEEVIKVTVTAGSLTHYYLAKKGDPCIYMATIFEREPQTQSLLRYILRTYNKLLPNGPLYSDVRGNTGAIESQDIFRMIDGQTRSKHYSNQRLCDWTYIGASGDNVGLWMVRGNAEGMSGGPFYRCLLNQCGTYDQEITYIVNYGMAQTEHYRLNVLNIYTLVFNDGSVPAAIDTEWLSDMNLKGWVGQEGRGGITGNISSPLDASFPYRVGFANNNAQYWCDVNAADKSYYVDKVLPGTYDLKLYKNELVVGNDTAMVTAGNITIHDGLAATDDPSSESALWKVGKWDGSPREFLNGEKITVMHPSDTRMGAWKPDVFIVGESDASDSFPAYQWREINNALKIKFTLKENEITDYKLRIGITISFDGGRPQVKINNWSSSPAASEQPKTRSLTVGTYRGNNHLFQYAVPARALVAGDNVLTISVISGKNGSGWLSPGYAFDAIDFIKA